MWLFLVTARIRQARTRVLERSGHRTCSNQHIGCLCRRQDQNGQELAPSNCMNSVHQTRVPPLAEPVGFAPPLRCRQSRRQFRQRDIIPIGDVHVPIVELLVLVRDVMRLEALHKLTRTEVQVIFVACAAIDKKQAQ